MKFIPPQLNDFSSVYVEENVSVVHVFFERQGFLKKMRGKLYDELVMITNISKDIESAIDVLTTEGGPRG